MALNRKALSIAWERGVIEDAPFSQQPAGSFRYALNMRPTDQRTGARRLAVRPGLRGLGTETAPNSGINVGGRVQGMGHVLEAVAPTVSNVKGRTTKLVVLASGVVKELDFGLSWPWSITQTTATGDTLDYNMPVVATVSYRDYVFFADGTDVYRWTAATNTVETLTAAGASNYPMTARLACNWRGRLVLSGTNTDPYNWFMSKVDEPLDWDYAPVPENETQAVAGNTAPAGLVPDIVNTLLPMNDDTLMIGGDHSLWLMRGDPAAGGRIDMLSDIQGMGWGTPWCKSPDGTIYFFGSRGGLFRMRGTAIERISNGKIESRLRSYDLATTLCRPVWNDREVGVNFFFTDTTGAGQNIHVFFDEATESFWLDQFSYPSADVSTPYILDGDEAGDRLMLLGGLDGGIRFFDGNSDWDETNRRDFSVEIGPLTLGPMTYALLDELELTFTAVDNVLWSIRSGRTEQEAYEKAAEISGTFPESASLAKWHRLRTRLSGNAIYLRLELNTGESSGSLAVDKLLAVLRKGSRTSQRLRGY